MMKLRFFLVIFVVCIVSVSWAYAGSYSVDFILDQVRKKKIPEYCAYMGVKHQGRTEKGRQLRAAYGQDWEHMHHYCWALVDSQKGYDWQAIDNLDYVLRNISIDSKLRPMVLKQKTRILMINNKLSEAAPVYSELIKVKPDDEEGYLGLAEIFLLQGDKKTAKEIVELGLKKLPESVKLQKLLE